MQTFSSMTNEELYRILGTLPADRLEQLLDQSAALESARETVACIREAQERYPEEGCLTDIIGDAELLHQKLRGQNRADMDALVTRLYDLESTLQTSTEYGIFELEKALNALTE